MLVKNLPSVECEVPHEPGNFFSFRRLSAQEMDEEQANTVKETIDRYGAEAMETFSKMTVPQGEAAQAARDNPLAGHSEATLVHHGLVSWRGPNYMNERGEPENCTAEEKAQLDDETRRWAALQVLEISRISEGEVGSSGDGSVEASALRASRRGSSRTSPSPS